MSSFASPLSTPTAWTYAIEPEVTIPLTLDLRYAGYKFRGLRATIGTAAAVLTPAPCILLRAFEAGKTFVEVQINPFPIQGIAEQFPWGLPTFYFIFDDAAGLSFADWDGAIENQQLRTASAVTIVMAPQNRVVVDPTLWTQQISTSISGAGASAALWQPFADAVANEPALSGASAPVLLLDHNGWPLTNGSIQVGTSLPVMMLPSDGGDLQKTMARTFNPSLFASSNSFTLTPQQPSGSSDFQLVRLEDGVTGTGSIAVTSTARNIALTNLNDWFAPQYVTTSALPRFTRGNKWKGLVNGPAFFEDILTELDAVNDADQGLHLAGWVIEPEFELVKGTDLTLLGAITKVLNSNGKCRVLASKLYQLEDDLSPEQTALLIVYIAITNAALILSKFQPSRFDIGSMVVLLVLFVGVPFYTNLLFAQDGKPLEQNQDAVDALEGLLNLSRCIFSPLPATIADNTIAGALQQFPIPVLTAFLSHFGSFHQKLSIVRNKDRYVGYCGGIDFASNRIDDADHLAIMPFHDVHLRIEGPAVSDLAITFADRWEETETDGLAFPAPSLSDLGTPGTNIAQVARTYYKSSEPSRQLSFAPNGDRTLADTLLRAIVKAQEFIYIEDQYFTPPLVCQDALLDKLKNGRLRKLIIVLPAVSDQLFGEVVRSGFLQALRNADTRNVLRVGYPRRRYTVPDNDLRASSGKCLLYENLSEFDVTIALGPDPRLPDPPCWVAVDGELIWVYAEDMSGKTPPEGATFFQIERGAASGLRTSKRSHAAGSAATVVSLDSIYVHAKVMIVDDVFLSVGSANLNRRSLFHDGEVNIFTMPESLKASPANPVAALRRTLWAEMLDLPARMAAGILQDPFSAAALFDRSPFLGNRFVDIEAHPAHLMLNATSGTGILIDLLKLAAVTLTAIDLKPLYDGIVDPSTWGE